MLGLSSLQAGLPGGVDALVVCGQLVGVGLRDRQEGVLRYKGGFGGYVVIFT